MTGSSLPEESNCHVHSDTRQGSGEERGRRFLFLFSPFLFRTSHLVMTQLMTAFSSTESWPWKSARLRNSPTSVTSLSSLPATFASSSSTSFAKSACERRKETVASSCGVQLFMTTGTSAGHAAQQPQTEVLAASPGDVASIPVHRRTPRAPLPDCPPASSPLPPKVTGCGEGCSDAQLLVSPRGFWRRSLRGRAAPARSAIDMANR